MKNTKSLILLSAFLFLLNFQQASAHENYVLTNQQINADLANNNLNILDALKDSGNLKVSLTVGVASLIVIILYFLFYLSKAGEVFDFYLQKLEPVGHVILRLALAASLIASAHFNSFLGPEIPLTSLPFGLVLKPLLYILGVMLALGIWSEITGAISFILLILATFVYRNYMITYFNYFGEFFVLMFFGSRIFSLDRIFHNIKEVAKKYHNLELAIIRITYGISVIYPAITYKLLHPAVIINIVNQYHLNQIHWLFPHDPLLISLGAGLTQIAVGIFIIFGFETRLSTLITFILMSMSVLFFKEAVWPHYILLALALYLIINNGGKYGLDQYIKNRKTAPEKSLEINSENG
jgi:uncharacterized membrane protein YphA (DoxX/SURF4 family)